MKKCFISLLAAILLILSGCKTAVTAEAPNIRPRAFSKETQEVLDLIGDVYFYDFTLNDTLKSYTLDFWTCADGQWAHESVAMDNFSALKHACLGFQVLDEGIVLYDFNENGTTKMTSDIPLRPDPGPGYGVGSYHLGNEQAIEANREIILCQYLVSQSDGRIYTGELGSFAPGHYSAGTALTITFYDHPLEA